MEIDEINNNRIFVGRKILYLGWLEFYYSRSKTDENSVFSSKESVYGRI